MTAQVRTAAGLCLLFAAGCALSSSTTEEGEDHLEHHVPDHKPKRFALAIPEVDRRFHELALVTEVKSTDARWTELADIVRWLPELASDSDLRKADWDVVQQRAAELGRRLQLWRSAPTERSSSLAGVESILAELKPIAARSEEFPVRTWSR